MAKAGRIVAIDSMVLVWGIRQEGSDDQRKRARWLFERLGQDEAQILIPSVAISEYVTPIQPEKRNEVIAALSSRFLIPPFDVRCAALAAQLFDEGYRFTVYPAPKSAIPGEKRGSEPEIGRRRYGS